MFKQTGLENLTVREQRMLNMFFVKAQTFFGSVELNGNAMFVYHKSSYKGMKSVYKFTDYLNNYGFKANVNCHVCYLNNRYNLAIYII